MPEVILPVGAGEAVALPGPPKLWQQIAGPTVTGEDLDGTTTWRLFQPGVYRFRVADGATAISTIHTAAWRVFPGKTNAIGDRRPEVALPPVLDAQAGHPLIATALNPRDADGDSLSYVFRLVNAVPPQSPDVLLSQDNDPRCVLAPSVAGSFDIECRVFDGQLFSHPAVMRVQVGAPPLRTGPFEGTFTLEGDDMPLRDVMERLARQSGATIAFQGSPELKQRRVSLAARNLPLLRILDLIAWQTGTCYRLDSLSDTPAEPASPARPVRASGTGNDGNGTSGLDAGASPKIVILWINGWDELRREPLVAGELAAGDFAQDPDGADLEPRLTDIVREALAARPEARLNLHDQGANLGVAVYLPRSAHDRLNRALTVLNKPAIPYPSLPAAAEARATALALHFETVDCAFADAPLPVAISTLAAKLHRTLVVNPPEAAEWLRGARVRRIAFPGHADIDPDGPLLQFTSLGEPGDVALTRFCAGLSALRGASSALTAPIEARTWAPGCVVLSCDPPLPEPSGRTPGPGQWLWQSATVQAYDLSGVLADTGGTGEWIEHRVRTQFAREFHDPAAHLSWWPRKKALLVIQRPAVQEAVANLLATMSQEERSPLHQPVALTATPVLGR